MSARETPLLAELEARVRARGVRVAERLALLRAVARPADGASAAHLRAERLDAVRRAAEAVRVEASGR